MSLQKALAEAVAFQVRFYNREDSELAAKRESLWAVVESEIDKRIEERIKKALKRK